MSGGHGTSSKDQNLTSHEGSSGYLPHARHRTASYGAEGGGGAYLGSHNGAQPGIVAGNSQQHYMPGHLSPQGISPQSHSQISPPHHSQISPPHLSQISPPHHQGISPPHKMATPHLPSQQMSMSPPGRPLEIPQPQSIKPEFSPPMNTPQEPARGHPSSQGPDCPPPDLPAASEPPRQEEEGEEDKKAKQGMGDPASLSSEDIQYVMDVQKALPTAYEELNKILIRVRIIDHVSWSFWPNNRAYTCNYIYFN